jgi:hypothetical protein
MSWDPAIKMTPRLVAMLKAEEQRATDRGDNHLGTEHLLEAIVEDERGVAREILDSLGPTVIDEIRAKLDGIWTAPWMGSLLMTEPGLPRDEYGHPYQVVTLQDRRDAPSRLKLDDDGNPLVWRPNPNPQTGELVDHETRPAPPLIADAARRWQAEH